MTFAERLAAAERHHGSLLCVGLDPEPARFPAGWKGDPARIFDFCAAIVDATHDLVLAFKPQIAYFAAHRAEEQLERLVAHIRRVAPAVPVILDAKRGDIGSTMQAYAEAYLDPRSPICADAVTVSPFLGFESLRPALDLAARHHAGVFVLARTSNPEGAGVQDAVGPDGRTVTQALLDAVRAENVEQAPWGSVGAVVGATAATPVPGCDIGGPLLAPGLGAQGATVDDLARVFGQVLGHVFPVSARAVLRHGPQVRALRAAADALTEQCRGVLG